ncbi:MAG: YHYH protein [Saprospiraceae bacterium]
MSVITVCDAQMNPLITSWKLNTTGATGYLGYTSNVKQVLYSTTSVYVKTNDLADYIPVNAGSGMGQVDWWPNNPWFPDSMGYTFRFRLNPTQNTGTPKKPPYGHIGVWVNGVSIYNPLDAKSYNNDATWFQNAFYWEHLLAETFDSCWGHPNQSHEYHTHQSPSCVYDQTDSLNHSPIIGFAFDGFPVYGCYAYTNTNGTGAIKRMKSSYRMRTMADRTTLPNGTVLAPAFYGPSFETVPLGGYQEDFEYVAGLGDLDDHNGRFCITPEYPLGIYAYFVTLDSTLTPVYPYAIGQTFYGKIIQTDGNMGPNSGFVTISEPVTNYIPSTTGVNEIETIMDIVVFPNPASDVINFVLKSNDFTSILKGEIFSQSGELIYSNDVNTNRYYAFSTSSLSSGIYYLKITSNNRSFTTKFMVTK